MQLRALGQRAATFVLVAGLAFTQTGCIKSMIFNGQAKATRKGSAALDEIGDYTVARTAAQNGLAQMEGMHLLNPDNEDVLFMLTRSWTSYGFAFAQDDMEVAEEGSEAYNDARERAKFAFNRAVHYGSVLLARRHSGFDEARHNEAELKQWLKDNFKSKDEAGNVFWAGYAWLARASLLRDQPEYVAELYVGVTMIRHSVELDPDYNHGTGYTALASYHARARIGELDEAKRLFELVIKKTERKSLLPIVSYAERYACVAGDRELYDQLVNEVLDFDLDSAPKYRLQNTIAVRRAKRSLRAENLKLCGFDPSKPVRKASSLDDGELSLDDFMKPAGGETPAETSPAPTP